MFPLWVCPPSGGDRLLGGARSRNDAFMAEEIKSYDLVQGSLDGLYDEDILHFICQKRIGAQCDINQSVYEVVIRIPWERLIQQLPGKHLRQIAKQHQIKLPSSSLRVEEIVNFLTAHNCLEKCASLVSVLRRPVNSLVNPFNMAVYTLAGLKTRAVPKTNYSVLGESYNHCFIFDATKSPYNYSSSLFPPDGENLQYTTVGNIGVTCDPQPKKPDPGPAETCPPEEPMQASSRAMETEPEPAQFPPKVHPPAEMVGFIQEWCNAVSEASLGEAACGCCGRLSRLQTAKLIGLDSDLLEPLIIKEAGIRTGGVEDTPILCKEAIVEKDGKAQVCVCVTCYNSLSRKRLPLLALANGIWLGEVPDELKELNFVEKLLVARYRHNVCVVRVSKGGQRKLHGNAIVFAQPVAKLHNILPPPIGELRQCLVLLFTGPTEPTEADFKRTPLLVRQHVVKRALEWLRDNHSDYKDLQISDENLRSYPENVPPVGIFSRPEVGGNMPTEALSSFGKTCSIGTDTGMCSFSVGGLTGEQYSALSRDEKVALATKYLLDGEPVLTYGRSSDPESIYNNPQLYPGMFPWLFPYGLGGFKNRLMQRIVNRKTHVRALLMYHDRRFQTDEYFPFLIFNQEQIRSSSTGGYLLTNKDGFADVADRLMKIDPVALESLIEKGKETGYVIPETDEEHACWDVLKLVELVAGHVDGSVTQKIYERKRYDHYHMKKGHLYFL